MNGPHFIGIIGHKKSGKTTLVERLAAEMTLRGMVVGTIKMTTHDLKLDSPGKDTYRHRAAGSQVTLIKSESEMALFTTGQYLDNDTIKAIFSKCDFVFIEGDSGSANPKIYIADSRVVREDIAGEIIAIWGEKKNIADTNHFNGDQIAELCNFITDKFISRG